MQINVTLTVECDEKLYAERRGIPVSETAENIAGEFTLMSDALTWSVVSSEVQNAEREHLSDVVQTILALPRTGSGGGIPLTRGEVAMLFLDGYAGDAPGLLDIRSQGYGEDSDWDGLVAEVIFEDPDTIFVWSKWEPFELWPD